jgi:hypothetical protein
MRMIRGAPDAVKGKQKGAGLDAGALTEIVHLLRQTVKDSPQPHVAFALGFENTKPLPLSPLV